VSTMDEASPRRPLLPVTNVKLSSSNQVRSTFLHMCFLQYPFVE